MTAQMIFAALALLLAVALALRSVLRRKTGQCAGCPYRAQCEKHGEK